MAEVMFEASGKCLEWGFVIVSRTALELTIDNCHSLAMNLHDQYVFMQKTGQSLFTPPTHVVATLSQAQKL